MRRPLKPFVTEYKGNGRRPSIASLDQPVGEPDHRAAARTPAPDASESSDGYEAAMRAADALFSTPRSDSAPQQSAHSHPAEEKGGGRILRALEEPPNHEMAALEARFAEKRRGRKPGSKNKPKPPVAPGEDHVPTSAKRGRPRRHPVAVATVPAIAASAALPNAAPPALADPTPHAAPKRSPWRGRAKPGENWKRRRLPPACW